MIIVNVLNKYLTKVGAKLERYPADDLKRRMMLLHHFKINKVLDVGAYHGEYAMKLRELGFDDKIISFEPLSKTYRVLKNSADKFRNWEVVNIALGDKDEEAYINVAGNMASSSLLDMLPSHAEADPESLYTGKEKIKVCKLDSILNEYYEKGDNIYLKIDTQGFEKQVLDGAKESLNKIKGIQLEMSIISLYNGEMLFSEMIELLKGKGFNLYSLENGFTEPKTGRLLQVDGIFFNTSI